MFLNINLESSQPIYRQIYSQIKEMIQQGMLPANSKLPSTREMASLLKVSRSSVIAAYELLESRGYIFTVGGKGTFVKYHEISKKETVYINWSKNTNTFAKTAENLDIMKQEQIYKKGMISFKSIAPDETLFDIDELKRSFLNLVALEEGKIFNYGYARGYKPLIETLLEYMTSKGVETEGKSILITNGFTEAFDIILSTITENGDTILCENPTHNTAIKIMRLHGLNLLGVPMTLDGLDLDALEKAVNNNYIKVSYLIPSYHNPTGIVMPFEKRKAVYEILSKKQIPIIEDGFTEELQHHGGHIAPISAISGKGNSVIYIGSFSKILSPGMRLGWIFADSSLIETLESVKRSRNIHTSFVDQGILYHYMKGPGFDKYIKRVRNIYRERYEKTRELCEKYIPNEYIAGNGGLYLFIKLKGIDSRKLLNRCIKKGVIFTPGDIFHTDGSGHDTLRIGFSRTSLADIEKGIKIIGEEAKLELNDI
ncbi:MAG: PLP-dependent aminotransferase family protein [Clostridiales bacterium]|uniref:aminotransferase-like domain-containing protein n=1 Tax=Clostridium sp. N3C TaxID=1776758 RepID=UPI00092DF059|nr:PLP-dependent aminotransferase family protein [Clostridium sp. N3C]NLZ49426.1 PLP-dependent aminotransferase family protein [Clostridiales bacterium]SCN25192.1 2-aminoadipate transaminase [Clostridium sp. N3C]